jgi:hypothetical protein
MPSQARILAPANSLRPNPNRATLKGNLPEVESFVPSSFQAALQPRAARAELAAT